MRKEENKEVTNTEGGMQLELDFQTNKSLLLHESELLELLLKRRGEYTTPAIIQKELSRYYPIESYNKHNDSGRLKIRKAIRSLRMNDNVDYLIISNGRGYKIATEKEAVEFKAKLKIAALKKWALYWSFEKKFTRDGQLKMMAGNELKTVKSHIEALERGIKNGRTK